MRPKELRLFVNAILLVIAITWFCSPRAAAAGPEHVLHTFNIGDGDTPYGGVVFGADGNLYGTTFYGGSSTACNGGCGVVYKLTPTADGRWKQSTLHTFNGSDGAHPYSRLVFDAAGNLYGMTFGAYSGGAGGNGNVYELSPTANGGWKETILHSFAGANDGTEAGGPVAFDAAGNLYGATFTGGAYNNGIVFELSPKPGGGWKETLLHAFTGGEDGSGPGASSVSNLILDGDGNLYGTTAYGGVSGDGVIFELSNPTGEGWKETVLHQFTGGPDGGYPNGLTADSAGNLYGGTGIGGNQTYCYGGCGVVYQLSRNSNGGWHETVLHTFIGVDGESVESLVFDAAGNLYGSAGGGGAGFGVIFELSPASGDWTEGVLYGFSGGGGGGQPVGVVLGSDGNLYGTALCCSDGVVFELLL
jgi:uncharacterized repeat protein (TIGR03803 family)